MALGLSPLGTRTLGVAPAATVSHELTGNSVRQDTTSTSGAVVVRALSAPNSDVQTTGWSATPSSPLYACIDEGSFDDADYITSPNVYAAPGAYIAGLDNALTSGAYTINFRARQTGSAGQMRAVLLDASNNSVGSSTWVALTSSFATYSPVVSLSGTATQIKLEVQP